MTKLISSYQKYQIPLIPNDLRQEETIHQLADVLDHLQKVADDVFKKVERRVEENKQRLRSVDQRIDTARARVEKIRGSNKATTVFSSSKYPVSETARQIPSAFTTESGVELLRRPNYRLGSKHEPVDERTLKEKLRFFNVVNNDERPGEARELGEGLGRLPNEPSSVSSLLLFNTSENPYKKYVLLDPLGVVTKTRAAVQSEQFGPGDAPSTIVHGESLEQRQKETYFYVPGMGAVPEIAVPKDLPLFGVAGDLSFGEDTGPSIAPSVFGKDAIPELPMLESLSGGSSAPPPPGQTPITAPSGLPTLPPPPPSTLPPPPPPPMLLSTGAPPPPPPPPPPPQPTATPTPVVVNEPSAASPAEGVVNNPTAKSDNGLPDRSSLLDDIRKAGGIVKLKSVKDKKVQKKKEKEVQKVESSGGDLMSDLAAKLQLRRKGISGGGSASKGAANNADDGPPKPPDSDVKPASALDRMSSLIAYAPQTSGHDNDEWSD